MTKIALILFSIFFVSFSSAESLTPGCSVDSLIQILNNKALVETTDKLCTYFYKDVYAPEELNADVCRNLVEPCALDKQEDEKKFQLKLTEFKLASQLKAMDQDYNREIADLEFFDSLKQNFSPEELKEIPHCSDTIKSLPLETCQTFAEIPRPALVEAQHYLHSAESDKLALDYVELTLTRGKISDTLSLKTPEVEELDKKIEEVTRKIQNGKFQNGFISEIYEISDNLNETILRNVKDRDQKVIFLSIYNFMPETKVIDDDIDYMKDKILTSWWSRFNGAEDSPQKLALEKVLKEKMLTPQTPPEEIKKLVNQIRFQMAKDVAQDACSEKSQKRHKEINAKGGLCKIVEAQTAKSKQHFSLEDYFEMYPEDEKTLKSDPKNFENAKKAFNKNMSLWTCSFIAPSGVNNADKHKHSQGDWMKVANSFSKRTKQSFTEANEKMSKAYEKSSKAFSTSEIISNIKKSSHKSVSGNSDTETKINVKESYKNTLAQMNNNTIRPRPVIAPPDTSLMANINTISPTTESNEKTPIPSARKVKAESADDNENEVSEAKKTRKIEADDKSEIIRSLQKEIKQMKQTAGNQLSQDQEKVNKAPPVAAEKSSQPQVSSIITRSDSGQNQDTPSGEVPKSRSNSEMDSSAPAPKIIPESGSKGRSVEKIPLTLTGKKQEEAADVSTIMADPKESDLLTMAEQTDGKPFIIQEKGEFVRVIPVLDAKGSIVIKNGKMVFKKVKIKELSKSEKSKLMDKVRLTKEVDHLPTRKHELDALMKKTSR